MEACSFREVWGHTPPPPPPRKSLEFRTSEITSAGSSGQNARAQAKVARACARVCQGLATPLPTTTIFLHQLCQHVDTIHSYCLHQCLQEVLMYMCISLIPRLSRNANMYHVESLVSFLHKHDVIKIGQKRKGNVLRVVQPTMLQHSVCMIFDAR